MYYLFYVVCRYTVTLKHIERILCVRRYNLKIVQDSKIFESYLCSLQFVHVSIFSECSPQTVCLHLSHNCVDILLFFDGQI